MSKTKIRINIETDIETCVHCPFWGLDSAQNIQYCGYIKKDLDTSGTSHPAVPDWCPFIVKDENKPDHALTLYNNFREAFPEMIPYILEWDHLGENRLLMKIISVNGKVNPWLYKVTEDGWELSPVKIGF